MEMDAPRLEWLGGAERARARWKTFLALCGLRYEGMPDCTLIARAGDEICGCAALDGDIVKYVAVAPEYRASGLAARMVSEVIGEAARRGVSRLFLFTNAARASAFQSLGFIALAEYADVALLEYGARGIATYKSALSQTMGPGVNGAVVMNANPFTLGHRYLVERAAANVDRLHLFVVKENGSAFPHAARFQMVRAGVAGIPGVFVHEGSRYVLSRATFPAYFVKSAADARAWQAGLDISLFARHIAPALSLKARFAGEEPLNETTREYNAKMREILPGAGVKVEIMPRLTKNGEIVSASRVRARLKAGDLEGAYSMLPESTVAFLMGDEGKEIIGRIRANED